MRKNKLKIAKIRWLLPLWVLIISAGILSFVANYVNMASYKQVRTKAKLNAVTYSDRMVDELNQGINITNSLENIIQVVATTIVMYNPHLLILTGENIKEDDLEAIQKGDLNYVPIHFMPSLKYQENCEDYYFQGLEGQIIQRIQF